MTVKKSESLVRGKQVRKSAKSTRKRAEKIDFSDIPELSSAQLKSMRRVGRPPLGDEARQLIAIRIDPTVLRELQEEAEKTGTGYQTLINEILQTHVNKAG